MTSNGEPDSRNWLQEILPQHEILSSAVATLLENMLKKKNIDFLSVTFRTKDRSSALEKITRKQYSDPEKQLTDLSGIRVITFLEEHVDLISTLVRNLFAVDVPNSRNRSELLGEDKVGYRSTHYVCTLGTKRSDLPEYEALGSLKFEIQVRTVLQHAWAELAHDRSFKFGTALPAKIQRKLNLYSGMLEVVDTAFDEISKEIDAYSKSLKSRNIDQIGDVEINEISLLKFVKDMASKYRIDFGNQIELLPFIFPELGKYNIKTVGELRRLISEDLISAYNTPKKGKATPTGFIRFVLAYNDLDKFLNFTEAPSFTEAVVQMLTTKYGDAATREKITASGKTIYVIGTPKMVTPSRPKRRTGK